jgi:hypothetical protein
LAHEDEHVVIEYRWLRWGAVTFVPLFFTAALIQGAVWLSGRDFDMPISVLSTLSLCMVIDFGFTSSADSDNG